MKTKGFKKGDNVIFISNVKGVKEGKIEGFKFFFSRKEGKTRLVKIGKEFIPYQNIIRLNLEVKK